jgi:hypothetical protein
MKVQTFQFLPHARKRAAQRGISIEMIKAALNQGEVVFRQGLRYFICLEKHLRGLLPPQLLEKYKNTVVILNSNNEVVTCYKSEKAVSQIRRKNKYLYNYGNNAKFYRNN